MRDVVVGLRTGASTASSREEGRSLVWPPTHSPEFADRFRVGCSAPPEVSERASPAADSCAAGLDLRLVQRVGCSGRRRRPTGYGLVRPSAATEPWACWCGPLANRPLGRAKARFMVASASFSPGRVSLCDCVVAREKRPGLVVGFRGFCLLPPHPVTEGRPD